MDTYIPWFKEMIIPIDKKSLMIFGGEEEKNSFNDDLLIDQDLNKHCSLREHQYYSEEDEEGGENDIEVGDDEIDLDQ